MNSSYSNVTYCDLQDFKKSYQNYHVYASVSVCLIGSVMNILNICVLSAKQMRCPTNYILTGLAASDLLVMVEYIFYIYFLNDNKKYAAHHTYNMACYIVFHALYTQALHFTSCCLTVIVAIWRYIAVKFPQNNSKWCSDKHTKWTIFFTYLLCPFICTPLFLSLTIVGAKHPVDENGVLLPLNKSSNLTVTIYKTAFKENDVLKYISYYVYGIIIKLIPCILLSILSALLIIALLEAKKRRRNLLNPATSAENGLARRKMSHKHLEKEKQADRTTLMLLAVLLLFLLGEFPQALLGLVSQMMGEKFEVQCFYPLGDLMDLMALICSSVNFILYCTMSRKFRDVFSELFLPHLPCLKRKNEQWTSLQTLKTYV